MGEVEKHGKCFYCYKKTPMVSQRTLDWQLNVLLTLFTKVGLQLLLSYGIYFLSCEVCYHSIVADLALEGVKTLLVKGIIRRTRSIVGVLEKRFDQGGRKGKEWRWLVGITILITAATCWLVVSEYLWGRIDPLSLLFVSAEIGIIF
jgi:hypothetical protein